ncbi:LOW QUALITY PROTEIN: sequestosome-1-like [Ctenocephalides felis]|uniref:LOW QUALITY PROTEIN: sequestosome-1-like n=1 Tax=Ctenocephalides felis TaxID=7515 RepID=UPI000E6E3637|nr:LOW QUALITY PROTEIN: sequestosome-1-like [Ctenocephalides felis]
MEIGNVAFKAFLYTDKNSENHEEVRWFHVDQNAVVSLDLVKQKLVSTFPRLVDREFKLYWKDCDNDLVLISTDTELLIALTNITTEPRRLYIYLEPTQNNPSNPSNPNNNVHHVGVVCDGCGGEIYGYRYKCVECPDFDLCSRCESNGVHSEHCFLRLTDFTATRRLRKCLSASRKMFRHCDREAGKHGKRHGGHPRHGWYELLSQFVADINSPEEETNKDNEKAESNAQKEAPKSKCPFMAPKSSGDSGNKESDCHVSYLRNIGQTIASLLDPLGIDVDVEVRSKDKPNDKMETENQTKDNEPKPSTSKTDSTPKPAETNNTNRAVLYFHQTTFQFTWTQMCTHQLSVLLSTDNLLMDNRLQKEHLLMVNHK